MFPVSSRQSARGTHCSDRQLDSFLSVLSRMEDYNRPESGGSASPVYGRDLHLKFLLGEFLLLTNQLYTERFGPLNTAAYQEHARLVYDIYEYIGAITATI